MLWLLRPRGTAGIVVVVLLASLLLGLVADRLAIRAQTPLDRARHLALAGELVAAEEAYLAIVAARPGDIPVLIELLEVHARIDDAKAPPGAPTGGSAQASAPRGSTTRASTTAASTPSWRHRH